MRPDNFINVFLYNYTFVEVKSSLQFLLPHPHILRWHPCRSTVCHDDVSKWKHFPRYWPFVRGIHRSPVNPPHKGQWRGALMFTLICAWINDRVNNRKAGDLRRRRLHYDVTVMQQCTRRKGAHDDKWSVSQADFAPSLKLEVDMLIIV